MRLEATSAFVALMKGSSITSSINQLRNILKKSRIIRLFMFQEIMFKLEGIKPLGFYITFIQFIIYTLCGYCELKYFFSFARK